MTRFFASAMPVTLALRHVKAVRSEQVLVEAGGLVCDDQRTVVLFVLGLTGHRDAIDARDPFARSLARETPFGTRLVYVLADLRREGDAVDLAAQAIADTVSQLAVARTLDRRVGAPQTLSEAYQRDTMAKDLGQPVSDRLNRAWRAVRSTTPNGYINVGNRRGVWRGTQKVDASVPLVELG